MWNIVRVAKLTQKDRNGGLLLFYYLSKIKKLIVYEQINCSRIWTVIQLRFLSTKKLWEKKIRLKKIIK